MFTLYIYIKRINSNRFISDGISKNCDPDDIITVFSQFITDRANPYFEKHSKQTKHYYFTHTNTTEKQQWYNDECKRKRTVYNNALFNFNLTKNNETRKLMLDAKKITSIIVGLVSLNTAMIRVEK